MAQQQGLSPGAKLRELIHRKDRVLAVLREITNMPVIRDRSVVRSSVIASAKYCCSGSLPRLTKGSTTIDRRGAAAGWEIGGTAGALGAGRAATASGGNI